MAQSIPCHCGHDVPFEAEDVGLEVYCPSCGAACQVTEESAGVAPDDEADAANDPGDVSPDGDISSASTSGLSAVESSTIVEHSEAASEARRSVFSDDGVAHVQTAHRDEVHCLCGTAIDIGIEDIGGTVYCPQCGSGVQVGRTLATDDTWRARAASADDGRDPSAVPKPRFRLVRSPAGLVVIVLLIASTAFGAYITRQTWSPLLVKFGILATPPKRTIGGSGDPGPFDPARLTLDMIYALRMYPDPFQALIQAHTWQRALSEHLIASSDERVIALNKTVKAVVEEKKPRMLELIEELADAEDAEAALNDAQLWALVLRDQGVASDDLRITKLTTVAHRLVERVDPITLEKIEALLEEANAEEALIQAQVWQESLPERGATAQDPRLLRLAEVVDLLIRRISPPPEGPPEYVVAFRDTVQRAAEALRQQDVEAAGKAMQEAEKLLEKHPDDLGRIAARYLSLKGKLDSLQRRIAGTQHIRDLFQQAGQQLAEADSLVTAGQVADAGMKVTDALYAEAKARFLAFGTKLTQVEIDAFEESVEELRPKITLAMGWRAVMDAERCQAAGDQSARNREVARAYALLPGLPERQIVPWLKRVEAWKQQSRQDAGVPPKVFRSGLAREIAARDLFETLLDHYRMGETSQIIAACQGVDQALADAGPVQTALNSRIGALVLDVAEMEISAGLERIAGADDEKTITVLLELHALLDQTSTWREMARWKTIDSVLRQRGENAATRLYKRATELARQDKLSAAESAAIQVAKLGPTELAQRADVMRQRWLQELQRRADKNAADETWTNILQLEDEGKYIDAWSQLQEFTHDFPDQLHPKELNTTRDRLAARLHPELSKQITQLGQRMDAGNWDQVVYRVEALESLVTKSDHRVALNSLRKRFERHKRVVIAEFETLGVRKQMIIEMDVLAVRRICREMLQFEPGNEEVSRLLKVAEEKASMRAKKLVEAAKPLKRTWRLRDYHKILDSVILLDPNGEFGRLAREMKAEK